MQNPLNLRVSGMAEDLAVLVYRFVRGFPVAERFELSAQMRRAAVSVGSNIFEGCGLRSNKALIASLYVAHGSVSELIFQLRLARRNEFGDDGLAVEVSRKLDEVQRSLIRLIHELERKSA